MAAPEPELVTAGVNLTALLPAVRQAGALIEQIKSDGVSARFKADASPVTAADEAANAVLVAALSDLYPDVPVISEEDTATHALAPDGLYFLVDPLDGTREFIRPDSNGAYTVNIGLIQNRRAVGGIVYAPHLDWLGWGGPNTGAVQIKAGRQSALAIRPCPPDGPVAVASRSHPDEKTKQLLDRYTITRTTSIGSSLKFLLLAAGEADLYPRFGPTMEWDTAAGEAVLAGAGGAVCTPAGAPHLYGKPGWRNGPFVACADFAL